MNSTLSGLVSAVWRSTRVLLALLVVLGLFYPAAVWVAGRAFAHNADGSMMSLDGRTVGSSLIAQDTSKDPALFHPRMSAGNYDGLASGGSNLTPSVRRSPRRSLSSAPLSPARTAWMRPLSRRMR